MSTIVKGYKCWRCGEELTELRFPVSRREECPECRAEIHVCKQCEYYDARVANTCREDRAEYVSDKEKANFCDYFKANADACMVTDINKHSQAKQQAESLFGGPSIEQNSQAEGTKDPAQAARDELKRLFGESD